MFCCTKRDIPLGVRLITSTTAHGSIVLYILVGAADVKAQDIIMLHAVPKILSALFWSRASNQYTFCMISIYGFFYNL